MGKRFFVLFLITLPFLAKCQEFSLRQYTALDGLPQSQVNIMLEDKNGYLWIGTYGGGLARFDGREFKVYTTRDGLLSNIVHYLKLDSKQNLWIVHPRGVTRFDGVNFKAFQPTGGQASVRRIRRIFELRDSIFLVSSQGMMGKIYDDSIYYWNKPVRKGKVVQYTHLLPNRDMALYLNDSSFLLMKAQGDVIVNYKKYFNRVQNIFNISNAVWILTDMGYFTFDTKTNGFKKGTLQVENHIVQYDTSTNSFWTRYDDRLMKESWKDGIHSIDTVLRGVTITQVFADGEGNTWFGSSGNGLYKYFMQDFVKTPIKIREPVFAIREDLEGSTWMGTASSGLLRIRGEKIDSYPMESGSEEGVTSIAIAPTGEVWAGATKGLGRYDKERDAFKWFSRMDGMPGPFVNQVDIDPKGNVWFGTNGGGLGMYNGKKFDVVSVEQGLPSRNVMSVHYMAFNKKVYAGTDAGLSTVQNGKASNLFIRGLENSGVNCISDYQDKMLLLGSGGAGVIVYNVETGEKWNIDTQVGLPSDFIYFVGADEEDRIWIGTEKGITKVKLDAQLGIEEILHFGYDNGLAGLETNQNSFSLGKQKNFGLIDGMYQYNDLRHAGWNSFGLHLTDVEIFNGAFPIRAYGTETEGFFKIPVNPALPSDKNHITFQFNRVDKRYPKSVRYQYILENYDKAWSVPSATNRVTYGNLPPGDYTFIVKATNNSGSWSKEGLLYSFTVQAPFYQTTAFQISMVILALGLGGLYLFYRVRTRINKMVELQRIRQQEQDSLRKEIARDFHDEMGNQLTRIINYISLMKLSKNGHTAELYNKVEDSAKYLYNGTRDFIWSIDPVNDELSKLFIHIRDFGDKLFNEKDINFRAYNEVRGNVIVPYGFSREANLIFKEAMTNSFNHSLAKNVSFTLRQEGEQFEMILEDDGRGFEAQEVDKQNGVKNMRSRADRIHSLLNVQSANEEGTVISLIFSSTQKKNKYGITI